MLQIIHTIKKQYQYYILYMVGFGLFILLSGAFIPFYINEDKTEAAVGTATHSTISLSLSSNNIALNLLQPGTYDANNLESGVFGSASTTASVSTTNYTGYTLSIAATNNNGSGNANNYSKLIDSSNTDTSKNFFASIESAVSEADFSANTATAGNNYNGKWGYKPSYYNSSANSNYLPAPSTSGATIEQTTAPNTTAKDYTITLGARANINQSAGSYSNTFNIVATANPVTYSITYSDNSGDSTIANLPSVQASSLNAQSKLNTSTISLSSTIPTRTGYTFSKWCLGSVSNSGTTCTGTEYSASADFGIDQTINNSSITLYAKWTINTYTCTKRYRLQNADGTYPSSYTSDGSSQINHGSTCSYSKSVTNYQTQSTSQANITGAVTLSLSLPRNTYTLTVNKNDSISSASGAGTYRWGQSVSLSASVASGNTFLYWGSVVGTKYSHTPNISDTGVQSGDYGNNLNTNEVVTVNGATALHIILTYQTESTNYDWVSLWSGSQPSYTASSNYGSGLKCGSNTDGKYGGTTKTTVDCVVDGNTVTFGFRSDGSVTNYGYYAVVEGYSSFSTSTSVTYTMPTNDASVMAVGEANASYIQDFSKIACQARASNDNVTVVDKRDNNSYTVRYINGNCWMTSNLRFTGTTLSPLTSNVASDTTINYGGASSINSYNVAAYVSGSNDNSGGQTVWYNFAAASAMTVTGTYHYADSVYDICPKNWHLPSPADFSSIVSYKTEFSPVYGGIYDNGTFTGQSITARWWSSKYQDNARFQYLEYSNNSLTVQQWGYRNHAWYIRCVRTLDNIQDVTLADCQSGASSSDYTVSDVRDNKTYTIRYINGKCWMTSNLRFTEATLSPLTSNVSSDTTINYGDSSSISSYDMAAYASGSNSDSGGQTVWYNFAAASAMTVTGIYHYADSIYDICPKNWHLPSSTDFSNVVFYKTEFNPVYGGIYDGSTFTSQSTTARWWSSKYQDNARFQYLEYSNNSLSVQQWGYRNHGWYIRCVHAD